MLFEMSLNMSRVVWLIRVAIIRSICVPWWFCFEREQWPKLSKRIATKIPRHTTPTRHLTKNRIHWPIQIAEFNIYNTCDVFQMSSTTSRNRAFVQRKHKYTLTHSHTNHGICSVASVSLIVSLSLNILIKFICNKMDVNTVMAYAYIANEVAECESSTKS